MSRDAIARWNSRNGSAGILPAWLIDIGLLKLDGYEVAGKMRLGPGMESAVLAALTGFGTTEDRERALVAGFQHHLTNPWTSSA
jgi:CheY-like chemotaxis protein